MGKEKLLQFLNKAVDEGRFGKYAQLIEVITDDSKGQDHFASSAVFVRVKLKEQNVSKSVAVVIKYQVGNEFIRHYINANAQFHNEALMYEDILPFLNINSTVHNIFPDNYFCSASFGEKPEDDVIIIENLTNTGFRLSKERLNLDYEHCVLAFKQLGRFHSLTYAAKQRDFSTFRDKISKIKEVRFENEHERTHLQFSMPSVMRGIIPLLKVQEYKEVLENFLSKIKEPFKFMKDLIRPEEPIAVIAHGDFCRNNVLYKYQDDKPIDIKLFDLGTSRYSSPAIDISLFLFLNVPTEIRIDYWDILLKAYHDSLSSAVTGTKVPTLEDIKMEMQRKAVYGYIMCAFFAPFMLGDLEVDRFLSLQENEIEPVLMNNGGELVTQYVVGMVKDLILKKCL